MKEYLTLCHAPGQCSLSLKRARRFTEKEKSGYAEWYRELGFVGTGDDIELENLSYSDTMDVIGDRKNDGSFTGYTNTAWIITQDQWDVLILMDSQKKEAKEEEKRQEEILKYRQVILHCECQRVLYTEEEARLLAIKYNKAHNEGGHGYIPHYYTAREYDYAKKRLAELGFAEKEKSDEPANELILNAGDQYGNSCTVKFTEHGWEVLDRTEKKSLGYLHVDFDSPKNVTSGVCESLIRYSYCHEEGLPGLGGTPQQKYLYNYSAEDRERIGNSNTTD